MLTIYIPEDEEKYDETTNEFIPPSKFTCLQLEHSLIAISKWEEKWHKAFLGKSEKTEEETLDYIKCMTINKNIPDNIYSRLTSEHAILIKDYIDNPMTATYLTPDDNKKISNEVITNELIYYWMIAMKIPVSFEKWHINHLLTLIQVCERKNKPAKKMNQADLIRKQEELNAKRRAALNSKG